MKEFAYQAYSRRFKEPLRTAKGKWVHREGILLRVIEGDRVGYGEVSPLVEFGTETFAEAEAYFANHLKSFDLDEGVPKNLPCCAFGLSTALRNLNEKTIGGDRDFEVAGLLPAGNGAEAELDKKLSLGYRVFKWKVGVASVSEEQAIFKKLAAQLPTGGRLRLDANAAWSMATFKQWLKFLKEASEVVEFIEQPLAVGLEAEMLAARAEFGIEIALDESFNGVDGDRCFDEWPGICVIKAPLLGEVGYVQSRLESLADRVVLSSVFETDIGFLNTLSLAKALPKLELALGFDTLCFSDALGNRQGGAVIHASELAKLDMERVWEANGHLI
ncbi:MAG: o-succinylbenzoate synthase [Opitutia bacterium UBA7350]|nr:MAG: o-succinylbenzoate synthase [Opitutae bacterium UBA7350]